MKNRFVITCILSAAIVVAPLSLQADKVDTPTMLSQAERSTRVELVETFIAREEVRNQMEAMGLDPALAAERVAEPLTWQVLANARYTRDNLAGAETALRHSLQLMPSATAHNNLAHVLFKRGCLAEAEAEISRAEAMAVRMPTTMC